MPSPPGSGWRSAGPRCPSTARGWLHAVGNEGLIKLVADADLGVLVGATSAGPAGGEVLGLLALAVHARVPITELRSMIYAYPTFHRGIEDALERPGGVVTTISMTGASGRRGGVGWLTGGSRWSDTHGRSRLTT